MSIRIATEETFPELIREDLAVVDFFSATCGPCKAFSRILEDVVAEIPFLNIVKVNTTENPDLAEQYGVRAVPTVKLFKNGELRDTHVGVLKPDELKEWIAKYLYE